MGKYIRKAKTAGPDLAAAMESSLGVRTRAKTLAAAAAAAASGGRSQSPSPPPAAANYLQLRSRRLLKPPIAVSKRQRQTQKVSCQIPDPNPVTRASSRLRPGSTESISSFLNNNAAGGEDAQKKEPADELSCREDSVADDENKVCSKCELGGAGEASFGDNVLEFEGRDRGTRESTPCSLVRDPDVIRTPGSSTRPTTVLEGANRRVSDTEHRHIPTSHEMDEFFAGAEEEQQRSFIEKYNFDPVNDKPLPGRYEWEKLEPKRR
ncbi:cyclin-dependent kinase inhibitor 5-like [Punica granatum]|uniref:Cyclin-dependent kinase inhibitor 5-like n=1 Tax=Punica granatum TaxID=22663 RepID=A0A6P8CTB2_PUNGR|nr:cyclin-dependent kinase inhibitor 5-like [Punica granatum]